MCVCVCVCVCWRGVLEGRPLVKHVVSALFPVELVTFRLERQKSPVDSVLSCCSCITSHKHLIQNNHLVYFIVVEPKTKISLRLKTQSQKNP